MPKIEYIKYEDKDNNLMDTIIPFKQDDIYYLSGEENYWIVSSGKNKDLQNPFVKNEIIAIAWDKITVNDIIENESEELKDLVEKNYKNFFPNKNTKELRKYISSVVNKLQRFVFEIKLGDIIVLKDNGSNKIYFGKVVSEAENYKKENLIVDRITGSCNKIRKVKWFKSVERNKIGSELKLALNVRHALSKINDIKVKEEINRELFSFFYQADKLHAVFKIETTNEITQDNLKVFLDYIYDLKQKFLKEHPEVPNELNIKLNIQSPGPIEFLGHPEILKYIYYMTTFESNSTYLFIKEILNIKNPEKSDREIDINFSRGN